MKYCSRTNLKYLFYGILGTVTFLFVFYKLNHFALPYLEKLSDDLQDYHKQHLGTHGTGIVRGNSTGSTSESDISIGSSGIGIGHAFDASMLVMVLLFVITAIPPVPGNTIVLLLCGIIYGFYIGILVAWISSIIGSTISFVLARYMCRDYIVRVIHKYYPKFNVIEKEDFIGSSPAAPGRYQ